ncbi:MAG: hypothetical protein VYE15_01310, partial [Myxococcota bacterium]|nr:hypothetical protein [Myxococcota bacterium]
MTSGCDSGLDSDGTSPAPGGQAALPSQGASDDPGGSTNTLPTATNPETDSTLCTSNQDCALDPTEVGDCKIPVCITESGRCELQNLPFGTLCDDGLLCTEGDACADGVCVPADPLSCDDENSCTQDSCDDAAGCVHVPVDGACDDDNPCTIADVCAVGVCIGGEPALCDDGDSCTTDGCAPDSGCTHIPHVGACDDGNACTVGDQCAGGQCTGQNITCSDGIPCTDDICDPHVGCTYLPDHGQCSPGDSCNNAICEVGVGCVSTPSNDGIPCNDNNACTQLDVCSQGICLGSPLTCPSNGNPCQDPYCDIVFGCTTVDNSSPCDDGDICTYSDT